MGRFFVVKAGALVPASGDEAGAETTALDDMDAPDLRTASRHLTVSPRCYIIIPNI